LEFFRCDQHRFQLGVHNGDVVVLAGSARLIAGLQTARYKNPLHLTTDYACAQRRLYHRRQALSVKQDTFGGWRSSGSTRSDGKEPFFI
jgi:hypothetical protein